MIDCGDEAPYDASPMTEVSYIDRRIEGPNGREASVTKSIDGDEQYLPLRLELYNHSPTGFEWGYGGSGPAQLALAILADATGDGRYARTMHQSFKRDFITGLDRDQWQLSQTDVLTWVERHPMRDEPEQGFAR